MYVRAGATPPSTSTYCDSGALNDWICRQPILADEIQTFKALITIHKVLQEGHPVVLKEAQQNVNWVESLARGVNGEGLRGMFCQGLAIKRWGGTGLRDCLLPNMGWEGSAGLPVTEHGLLVGPG